MKRLLLTLAALLFTANGDALLPPLWESVAQIKTVLDSTELKNYLESGERIESLSRSDEGFIIITNASTIRAIISPEPQHYPGPAKYHVHFEKEKVF
ncbi:hypothetical protein PHSC3_000078 [Chlamydiales bacterium STE3]|nr:hypothetical protein PHSC3_000078 [Chlamydiales bacterium STE3]